MFFALSKILEFLLSPFTWIVGLMIAALWVKIPKRKKTFGLSALVLLVFFSNPFISNKVMDSWEYKTYPISTIEKPYDIAVLLGGSLRYFDTTSQQPVYSHSVDRLIQCIALYKEKKIKKILLSGGSGILLQQSDKESDIILKVLLQAGIPATDIIIENQSRNTYENALFSTEIIKRNFSGSSVLLITSAFHMQRSLACFHKAGLNPVPFPVDRKARLDRNTPDRLLLPDPVSLIYWDILIHEWFGMVTYKIQGYI